MAMRFVQVGIATGLTLLSAVCVWGAAAPQPQPVEQHWGLLEKYCFDCHNATDWAGGVAFDTLQPESVAADAEVWEKAVRKLRGRMMPPPGKPQPETAALQSFVMSMETQLDRAALANPNPG